MQRQTGESDDAVHRGADLVAHVGQKLAFGPVGRFGLRSAQFQRPVELLQLQFGQLELRNVGHHHEKAAHPLAIGVGQVVRPGIAGAAVGLDQGAFEMLGLATQCGAHEGFVFCEQFRTHQVLNADAAHLFLRLAEPLQVNLVGEAAAQLVGPVTHHAGNDVDQRAQKALPVLQRLLALPAFGDILNHYQQ